LLKDNLAELAEEVRVVDMYERVIRGSRRARARRRAVASVVAAIAMSGAALAVIAVRLSPQPLPPKPSATPTAPTKVDIRNAVFDVPEFPGVDWCPAARRWFGDGSVRAGGTTQDPITLRMTSDPLRADIDGVPGDEILVEVACTKDFLTRGQVLAVKVTPDGNPVSLGYVLRSPDHATFMVHPGTLRVENGTILVDVLGPNQDRVLETLDLQTRGYAYRDGGFVQVSGPTRFAEPAGDFRRLDFRNITTCVRIPHPREGWAGDYLRIADGKGTVTINQIKYEVTVVSSTTIYGRAPYGVVLYNLQPSFGGRAITVINVYLMYKPIPCAYDVMVVADVDGATKVEASGGQFKVTIDGKVKTYHTEDGGLSWVSSA
jgi:hypothetical protein